MRFTIATAAIVVGTVSAQYGYPAVAPSNSSSAVETPSYAESSAASYPESSPAPVYVTKTVSEYETYCPGPTQITHGTKTYTITEETTIKITDCPCTITETSYPVETPAAPTSEVPEVPSYPTEVPSVPAYPIPSNGTVPTPPVGPTGTGAIPSASQPPTEFPGAASQMGVGLLAVVGAVAAFL